jgi:hypothetical protein
MDEKRVVLHVLHRHSRQTRVQISQLMKVTHVKGSCAREGVAVARAVGGAREMEEVFVITVRTVVVAVAQIHKAQARLGTSTLVEPCHTTTLATFSH